MSALFQQRPQHHNQNQQPLHLLLKTLSLQSLSLLLTQPRLFLSIFLFFTLPLSFLLFSFSSFHSHPITSHVLHLHSIASLTPTEFEAHQIWKESRQVAISLFYTKILFFLPSYLLSLASSLAAVTATISASSNRYVSLGLVFSALKSNWAPPLVTSICAYALMMVYSGLPRVLLVMIGTGSHLRLAVWFLGSGFEVYLMGVIGLGMVGSIVEGIIGWEAIRVGLELMKVRWVCGWILTGLMALATGGIGWRMEVLMGAGEAFDPSLGWMVDRVVVGWEWVGLVGLYGVVVVWGYLVATLFYCECRKRIVTPSGEENGVEGLNL